MNEIINKKETILLDQIVVLENWEYLKDHLVMEDLLNQSKKENVEVQEDQDTTILICTSDYED
ncbi:unnamed protein product [Paramecium octaurelia]|uniref:Uncharacterized protein n=1 Tax=Paramecium octaurelia TaxID=43137 RepID=A0A8S1TC75_PAROT|nr:unnamed protein product [Paramecium octaurelia]